MKQVRIFNEYYDILDEVYLVEHKHYLIKYKNQECIVSHTISNIILNETYAFEYENNKHVSKVIGVVVSKSVSTNYNIMTLKTNDTFTGYSPKFITQKSIRDVNIKHILNE